MPRKSILTQLIALILLIALPLIALIGYKISQDFTQAREQARVELHVMRRLGEKQLTNYLDNLRGMLEHLAANQANGSPENLPTDESFRGIMGLLPDFYNLAVLDAEGRILVAGRRFVQDRSISLAKVPPYDKALAAPGFFISAPSKGQYTERWAVAISQPLVAPQGQAHGILVVPVGLLELSRKLFLVQRVENADLAVITTDGTVILRTLNPEQAIGQKYSNT